MSLISFLVILGMCTHAIAFLQPGKDVGLFGVRR
jgi:hypothetical protein